MSSQKMPFRKWIKRELRRQTELPLVIRDTQSSAPDGRRDVRCYSLIVEQDAAELGFDDAAKVRIQTFLAKRNSEVC